MHQHQQQQQPLAGGYATRMSSTIGGATLPANHKPAAPITPSDAGSQQSNLLTASKPTQLGNGIESAESQSNSVYVSALPMSELKVVGHTP